MRKIVVWWELRRIAFNIIVGLAGLLSCAIALGAGAIVEANGGEAILPNPPIFMVFAVFLHGVMANLCYTGGWICELMARRWWPREASAFGRLAFMFGLAGSVMLTLLPSFGVILLSMVQLIAHHASRT